MTRYYIETFVGWSAVITAMYYNNVWLLIAGVYVLATRRIEDYDGSSS